VRSSSTLLRTIRLWIVGACTPECVCDFDDGIDAATHRDSSQARHARTHLEFRLLYAAMGLLLSLATPTAHQAKASAVFLSPYIPFYLCL